MSAASAALELMNLARCRTVKCEGCHCRRLFRTDNPHVTSTKRRLALVLAGVLVSAPVLSALEKNRAAWVGGTIMPFGAAKEPVEGRVDASAGRWLVFTADATPHAGQRLQIPYDRIHHVEYGQKAGRRVATVTGATVLLGPVGLVALASKKRAHYLTLTYADDDGKDQVAILELGKDIVRATLATIERRSGQAIEYQDEEARQWSR
jgi:hypothetical protein